MIVVMIIVVMMVVARGGKNIFLSGNLGRRLEIFCKICNVTITKITKQMHNYCIICTLVIIGFRQLLYARTSQ